MTSTSRNIVFRKRGRQCPCADEHCYVQNSGDEDEEQAELGDLEEQNFHLGSSKTSSEPIKVINPPFIGQTFQTDEEAQDYYAAFAQKNGFAIRRERSKGNPQHPLGVYKREIVCHRAGLPLTSKNKEEKRQRNKKSSRCKCEAQMIIKKNIVSGIPQWVVVTFSNVHNHELFNNNDSRHAIVHRYISAADREHIITLAKAGCSLQLIVRNIEMQRGVKTGELYFSEKDVRIFLEASKNINRENEGLELLKVCKAMKDKNPDFRYDISVDEGNKLEHIAWSYSDSVRAFHVFGDVIVFDTSYHLHLYDRPVGVWFGVDNHGLSIFFGFVLLQDAAPHSFRWALQSFIRLMDGKFPQTILTDLNMDLKEALLSDWPNTKHAVPRWYIMSKFPSWFSATLGPEYNKFKSDFHKLYDSETTEEFEHRWNILLDEFGLISDRHVSLLSSHKSYWALPFLKGLFFGGLITRTSPISIKSFFKGFLSSDTHLKDLVEQVGVAFDFQNQAREEARLQENSHCFKTKTCMPIEEHASTIFTQYAFEMFQKEIILSSQYAAVEISREIYLVRHHLMPAGGHTVTCIPSDEVIYCSCKGFETSGILCRHCLRVLSFKNCFAVPEKYATARWCKDDSLFPSSNGYSYRSQALCSLASIIVQEASVSRDRFDYMQWQLGRMLSHLREMGSADECVKVLDRVPLFDSQFDIVPARTAARGRPRKAKEFMRTNSVAGEVRGTLILDEADVI